MERSYPRRHRGDSIRRYLGAISDRLPGETEEAGELVVEGELDADRAELILVDDLDFGSRGTTGTRGVRADVVYVDEERGTAYFDGPICGARHGDAGAAWDLVVPLPLPTVLWRGRVSAGTWVLVTSRTGEGYTSYERALIRVTPEVLERGRSLALDLEWCVAAS